MATKSNSRFGNREQNNDSGIIQIEFDDIKAGWEQWFCIMSDIHWDNPKCDRVMLKRDLEQAKQRKALIVMTGDIFCLMQGKYDPRSQKGDTRTEHNKPPYLNSVLSDSLNYFSPYSDNILMASYGNHETSIVDRCGFDMIDGFVQGLNATTDKPVLKGGYNGYIRMNFLVHKTKRQSLLWYYTHGHGGGGEVTKGVLQAQRRAVWNPDAKLITSGHIHEQWLMHYPRYRVTDNNKSYLDSQLHIQTGTYKEEYQDGKPSYHTLKGRPPKPLGCSFFRLFYDRSRIRLAVETVFDMGTEL
jgi:hypothetical protein